MGDASKFRDKVSRQRSASISTETSTKETPKVATKKEESSSSDSPEKDKSASADPSTKEASTKEASDEDADAAKKKEEEDKASMLYTDNIAAACAATNELASGWMPSSYQDVEFFNQETKRQRLSAKKQQGLLDPENLNLVNELRQGNAQLVQQNLALKQELDNLKQEVARLLSFVYPQPGAPHPPPPPPPRQQQQQQQQQQATLVPQQQSDPILSDLYSGLLDSGRELPANVKSLLARRFQQQQHQKRAAQAATRTAATGNNPLLTQLLSPQQQHGQGQHQPSASDLQRFLSSNTASDLYSSLRKDSASRFDIGKRRGRDT
jgi:hypothetical protein